MQINLKESLKSRPALAAAISRITLRRVVQLFIVAVFLIAAWQFSHFVQYVRGGGTGVEPYRPPVVEGFLPVAAFVAFKVFLGTGQFDTIHPAGLIILITTFITAFIFRRALCSWICPIGTLSEYLGRLGQKIMGRQLVLPKWLDGLLLGLKYVLFVIVFSIFFSMSTAAAASFLQIPYYAISDMKMFDFFTGLSVTAVVVIAVLIVLSVFIKSFWCRYLCPYGALLGILGFISPIFLTKNTKSCTHCGLCNKACPNKVNIEGKGRLVASTECTGCTSCVTACPRKGTLEFKLFGVLPVKPLVYSLAFLVTFFGIIMWAKMSGHWVTTLSAGGYRTLDQMMSSFGGSF